MNLTLGTLTSLKAWLLPESERSGTEWDSAIAAIGKGAAGALEKHCHRKFGRVVEDTFECTADRAHVVLPRYPVEAVTKIEIRRSMTEGWVELTDVIENQNLANGFLLFGSDLGSWSDRLRITYTGGFWVDSSGDAPTSQQAVRDLEAADEEIVITFDTPFETIPVVLPVVIPASGGTLIQAVPHTITAAGFTVRLGFPVPASGYQLQWMAFVSTADPAAETATFLQDSVALAAAAETLDVVFATPFASAPAVTPVVVPPSGGTLIQAVPHTITATGFSVRLGFPVPATGYTLQWVAILPEASAQPSGSTAVPSDLQLAWMQQSALVWRQKDKLGSALASNSGEAATMQIALDAGVIEAVYQYRRLSLT